MEVKGQEEASVMMLEGERTPHSHLPELAAGVVAYVLNPHREG